MPCDVDDSVCLRNSRLNESYSLWNDISYDDIHQDKNSPKRANIRYGKRVNQLSRFKLGSLTFSQTSLTTAIGTTHLPKEIVGLSRVITWGLLTSASSLFSSKKNQ